MKNVGRVGIVREKAPYTPWQIKVLAEEDQQAYTQRHTHNCFPERVDQRLPVESAFTICDIFSATHHQPNEYEEHEVNERNP